MRCGDQICACADEINGNCNYLHVISPGVDLRPIIVGRCIDLFVCMLSSLIHLYLGLSFLMGPFLDNQLACIIRTMILTGFV